MKTIMEIQHVSRLYGVEKEKAAKLLEAGWTRKRYARRPA